ncbi:hypothetical protein BGZ83_005099 [Gryganskiella cystojenkinii]|nr:hypothetical protein BGZ83_005099 [Gryganskiella cystojenkinii]
MSLRKPSRTRVQLSYYVSLVKRKPVHKRVPIEVWEKVLCYLYPSQLSRLSMADKNFRDIVSSQKIWSRMFSVAYGPKAHLRLLVLIPKFKNSYMMFMCASSLHVCEKCFGLTKYEGCNLSNLPLPIPVLLPRRSTGAVNYVGERFDPDWTIRMCISCRNGHLVDLEEPRPRGVSNFSIGLELYKKYPCAEGMRELRELRRNNGAITELDALNLMRLNFGGDIGMKSYKTSTVAYDEKTETRIRWYQRQE